MKVNHEQTKTKIFDIATLLREQARYAKNYKQEQIKITSDDTYAQEYKNSKIDELRKLYNAKHTETKTKIVEKLNEIREIELEQEKILDLDIPEFANTIAAISAANGKLPSDIITGIKLKFAGHYQALMAIKAIFDRCEIDLAPFGYEEYITSASFVIDALVNEAENMEQEEVASIVSLQQLFNNIIHFGEVRGIKFSDGDKTFGDGVDDEVREILARRAMGLPDTV